MGSRTRGTGTGTGDIPEFLEPATIRKHIKREREWGGGAWQRVDQPADALAAGWAGVVRDSSSLIDEQQERVLIDLVSRFAHAYGSEQADEYIALVHDLPWLEWRENSDSITYHIEYYSGKPVPAEAATAPEMFRVLWQAMMLDHGLGWREVGAGLSGALISISKTYVDQPGNGLETLRLSEEEFNYWGGMPMHAHFHNVTQNAPNLTPDESVDQTTFASMRSVIPVLLLRQGPPVVVAYSHVLVRTRGGWPLMWQARWVWEKAESRWVCDEMVVGTGRGVNGVF